MRGETMGRRRYWAKKDTVEESRTVEMAFLRQHGYLQGGYRPGGITWSRWGKETDSIGMTVFLGEEEAYARFQYTNTCRATGEKSECDYKIQLVTTPCHLGGVRYWFICPLCHDGVPCGRRVGTLYCPPGAIYYGCRHCHKLSYESRNESKHGRSAHTGHYLMLASRMEKLRKQIRRWNYQGLPTRRAGRLYRLAAQMNAYADTHLASLKHSPDMPPWTRG